MRKTLLALLVALAVTTFAIAPAPAGAMTRRLAEQLCLDPGMDFQLDAYAYVGGYLFCSVSDEYAVQQSLSKRTHGSTFARVRSGRDMHEAADLERLGHVPPAIAERLVADINEQQTHWKAPPSPPRIAHPGEDASE